MKKATDIQILTAIQTFKDENDYCPTVREVGEMVGLSSSSTVHARLHKLEKTDLVKNVKIIRGLGLTEKGLSMLKHVRM